MRRRSKKEKRRKTNPLYIWAQGSSWTQGDNRRGKYRHNGPGPKRQLRRGWTLQLTRKVTEDEGWVQISV